MTAPDEWQVHIAEECSKDRAAVHAFIDAVLAADGPACWRAIEEISARSMWLTAMRAVARNPATSDEFRRHFLAVYVSHGDRICSEMRDDLVLCEGLRALLPRYNGPALTIYRGEGHSNRRRRTYGLAWSADREVAKCFAANNVDKYRGGTVLLQAHASADAIICAPALMEELPHAPECEYIVDRRRLSDVKVLERFVPMRRPRRAAYPARPS